MTNTQKHEPAHAKSDQDRGRGHQPGHSPSRAEDCCQPCPLHRATSSGPSSLQVGTHLLASQGRIITRTRPLGRAEKA